MKLSRGQVIAGLSLILTLAIAFLTGIVNSFIPLPWVQSHIGLISVLLALLITLLLFITLKQAGSNNPVSLIKEDQFNDFVKTVSDAESKAQVDPIFEHIPYIAGKLVEWQDMDARLIDILNITYDSSNDTVKTWQRRNDNERLARLVLRLTRAILPALTRSRPVEELAKLAAPAYAIAEGLKEWTSATHIAYTLASSFYDARDNHRAKHWMAQMEKSLKHINVHNISDDLYSQFFDIKGIITRDFDGDLAAARKHFKDALIYANRTKTPLSIRRITVHLATLEKKERNFAKAIELYNEALGVAAPLNDPGLMLECYQALGDLALNEEKNADSAYDWYIQQLQLATISARPPHQARAHRGLADCLLLKSTPHDTKQAYYHAREALKVEENIKGPNRDELYVFLIHIADLLWNQH